MADYKTVILNGEEVCAALTGRNCHMRNLGGEMIYASVRPGIVPDADGVLGVPAGAVDTLHDTCGRVYLKGNGKVQLVGSDYGNGCLGGLAGSGDINAAVAAAVAKIVAGAPADFDTLKEISDWIYSHADSAAAMNSEIAALKTNKADKTEIPTDYAKNKVLTTIEDVNNPDLASGIYSVERVDMTFPYGGKSGTNNNFFMLIVNKFKESSGYGVQIAVPFFEGSPVGTYYRLADISGVWSAWLNLADGGDAETVDGLHANEIASNPNLLINPDFRINQRGATSYTTPGFTVDRWYADRVSVTPTETGVHIENNTASTAYFFQRLEDFKLLDGLDIALSLSSRGQIFSANETVDITTIPNLFAQIIAPNFNVRYDRREDMSLVIFEVPSGKSFDLEWTKLEIGKVATPFVPPDPATELLKCQRYYYKFPYGADRAFGSALTTTVGYAVLPLPTKMRVNPTVTNTGGLSPTLVGENGSKTVTSVSITSAGVSNQGLFLKLAFETDSVSPGQILILRNGSPEKLSLEISAELI